MAAGNLEKTMAAPATAIIAYDLQFYEKMTKLYPVNPGIRDRFANAPPEMKERTAFRNGTLQGGYFILAARAAGLDCGPMSGFDNAKVDQEFFPEGTIKSNFLCNLGYGDPASVFPRNPRLDFEEACKVL